MRSVALLGGHSPDWAARDPSTYPTIIDAERHGRGVTIYGTGAEVVTMTGFTVTGGDYTGLGNADGVGNTVCRFTGADCGGGIYVRLAALILRDAIVRDNIASVEHGRGGGIYLLETADNRPVELYNVQIISNTAGTSQGYGGGIYSYRIQGGMRVDHSLFQDNFANTDGGGIYLYDTRALVEIVDTSILSNVAGIETGGAAVRIVNPGELLRIDRTIIQGNEADRYVGLLIFAAGASETSARVTNVLFAGNRARQDEPYASVVAVSPAGTPMSVTMDHVTAADNQAPTFFTMRPTGDPDAVTLTLRNTLIVSFTNAFVIEEGDGNPVTLKHNHTLTWEVGNLHVLTGDSVTAVATDQLTGDPLLDETYHLQEGSPAIDAGAEAGVDHDIDGDPRPLGAPDIGADEWLFGQVFLPLVVRG
jgi:hypothetical protein